MMDWLKAQEQALKHRLAGDLRHALVEVAVDPRVTNGRVFLPGDIAIQNSLFIYGLISTKARAIRTDEELECLCRKYGIAWTRCVDTNDIFRVVNWAMGLQDKTTHCQTMPHAA